MSGGLGSALGSGALSGALPGSGGYSGHSPGGGLAGLSDGEDFELPMLEHTTALSDGYASPRPLDGDDFRRGSIDMEVAARLASTAEEAKSDVGVELGPGPVRSAAAGQRRGCCGGVCTFILSHWSKAALLAVIISLIVLVSVRGVRIFSEILNFFEKWNNWGGWGIFIGMFIVNVTLFLPGVALILGAGFVFGFWKGLLAVWVGGAIGQALSFLLARYLVKDAVTYYVAKNWKKWDLVELVLEQEGWKMVLLLRLSPLVPWNLLNITMATTSIPFWQFTIASAVGIGFESSVLCYFGSLAQNIRDIVSGEAKPQGPVVYVLAGCSLLFCFLAAAFATVAVRRALKRADNFRKTQDEEAAIAIADGGGATGETYAFLQEGVEPSNGAGLDDHPASGRSSPRAPHRSVAGALGDDSGFSSDDSSGTYGQKLARLPSGALLQQGDPLGSLPLTDSACGDLIGTDSRYSPVSVGGAIEMHEASAAGRPGFTDARRASPLAVPPTVAAAGAPNDAGALSFDSSVLGGACSEDEPSPRAAAAAVVAAGGTHGRLLPHSGIVT